MFPWPFFPRSNFPPPFIFAYHSELREYYREWRTGFSVQASVVMSGVCCWKNASFIHHYLLRNLQFISRFFRIFFWGIKISLLLSDIIMMMMMRCDADDRHQDNGGGWGFFWRPPRDKFDGHVFIFPRLSLFFGLWNRCLGHNDAPRIRWLISGRIGVVVGTPLPRFSHGSAITTPQSFRSSTEDGKTHRTDCACCVDLLNQ